MSITVARLLRHMAWANQETIKHLQTLPEESLKAYATNPEWFVAEIAHHIVDSADHYALNITGKVALTQPGDPCIADIEKISDLARLAEQAAIVDAVLVIVEFHLSLLEALEIEDIIDQAGQPLGIISRHLEKFFLLLIKGSGRSVTNNGDGFLDRRD